MATDHIVKKQITINAPPSAVWDALTNPEKTKKYFFHCKVYSNWKVGSPIIFKGKIFLIKKIELKGEILRVEKEKILKYTLQNEGSNSTSTVTDKLSFENGKTLLSITDDVGAGEDAQKRYDRSQKGWDKILKGLKNVAESDFR
jgi:uncharacterized protein YndB with AHSA1/START domain